MNISSPTSFNQYTSPTASAVGASAVGEESAASRRRTLPPVEESGQSASTSDKRDEAALDEGKQQASKAEALQQVRDQEVITELKARDREVRAHEAAHAAVGGQYAGAPTYSFQRGPNGVSYAVGGEVSISTGAIANDPEATLQKAQQVQRAALAPAEPSTQDRRVAAEAAQMATQARVDLAQLRESEQTAEQASADSRAELRAESRAESNDESVESETSTELNPTGESEGTSQSSSSEVNTETVFATLVSNDSSSSAEELTGLANPVKNVAKLLVEAGVREGEAAGQFINRLA